MKSANTHVNLELPNVTYWTKY